MAFMIIDGVEYSPEDLNFKNGASSINVDKNIVFVDGENKTKPDFISFSSLCQECGEKLLKLPQNQNKKQKEIFGCYPGKCDCCKLEKAVINSRDFEYPILQVNQSI